MSLVMKWEFIHPSNKYLLIVHQTVCYGVVYTTENKIVYSPFLQ